MAALPRPEDKVWTYADYCKLPSDGNRYEIIDGRLYMTPSPSMPHQSISRRLQFLFYELERQGKGFIINAPADLFLPGAEPVVPDLMYVTIDQKDQIHRDGVHGPPELLVEILSPRTAAYDRTTKQRLYARSGVRHYWLVHPIEKTLEAYRLGDDGHYVLESALQSGETYEPPAFEGIQIDLEALFADLPGDE